MAYVFDKIMKAEKHEFFYSKNRYNSRYSLVLAFSADNEMIRVGTIDNRTEVFIIHDHPFNNAIIKKLKQRLYCWHEKLTIV